MGVATLYIAGLQKSLIQCCSVVEQYQDREQKARVCQV